MRATVVKMVGFELIRMPEIDRKCERIRAKPYGR